MCNKVTKFGKVTKVDMKMAAAQRSERFFASPRICDDGVIFCMFDVLPYFGESLQSVCVLCSFSSSNLSNLRDHIL